MFINNELVCFDINLQLLYNDLYSTDHRTSVPGWFRYRL